MPSFTMSVELRRDVRRWMGWALGIGGALSLVSVIGGFFSANEFFRSYLMSYLFWLGLALGSMAIVMLQYLTGGAWGVVTRRTFESATRTLPLLALLFIPIAIGIPTLYDWANSNIVRADDVLQHRSPYMNPVMFVVRAAIYFTIWIGFMYLLNRWSAEQDERGGLSERLAALSAPGLILYVFTVTFASVDWAESLETHWSSTMWGFLFVARQGLTAMAFGIIALTLLSQRKPLAGSITPAHFHDLGKLLLMFVMLWAYFAFSELVIVWTGNLTDEIPWYLKRFSTSWGWLGVLLIIFQFVIPFLLLLSRSLKRNPWLLSGVVALVLFMRFVDLMWIVMPGYYREGFRLHWLNISVPIAMGGLWLGAFLSQLGKLPLLPLQAPNLQQALDHGEPEG